MPASETQHSVWRKNLQGNFGAALRALTEGDTEKAILISSMNETMSRVILGERIAQLSSALNSNSEIVSEMADRDQLGRDIVQRLVASVRDEDVDLETSLALAEDWAEGTFNGLMGLDGAVVIPEEPVEEA